MNMFSVETRMFSQILPRVRSLMGQKSVSFHHRKLSANISEPFRKGSKSTDRSAYLVQML